MSAEFQNLWCTVIPSRGSMLSTPAYPKIAIKLMSYCINMALSVESTVVPYNTDVCSLTPCLTGANVDNHCKSNM